MGRGNSAINNRELLPRKTGAKQCIAHVQDAGKTESRRVVKFPTSFVSECCYSIAEYAILIVPNGKTRRHGVGCTLTWDQHICASVSRIMTGRACEKIHSLFLERVRFRRWCAQRTGMMDTKEMKAQLARIIHEKREYCSECPVLCGKRIIRANSQRENRATDRKTIRGHPEQSG